MAARKTKAVPKIKSCYPAQGEWFVLTNPDGDAVNWQISRVVFFALIEKEGAIDHMRAIDAGGLLADDGYEHYFVYGPDASPLGKTWSEVYHQADAGDLGCKWISIKR